MCIIYVYMCTYMYYICIHVYSLFSKAVGAVLSHACSLGSKNIHKS